jgi:hypothetical protein
VVPAFSSRRLSAETERTLPSIWGSLFWLRSTALADADEIALDLQQAVTPQRLPGRELMLLGNVQARTDGFISFDDRFLERIAAMWPACMAVLAGQASRLRVRASIEPTAPSPAPADQRARQIYRNDVCPRGKPAISHFSTCFYSREARYGIQTEAHR